MGTNSGIKGRIDPGPCQEDSEDRGGKEGSTEGPVDSCPESKPLWKRLELLKHTWQILQSRCEKWLGAVFFLRVQRRLELKSFAG